VNVTTHLSVRMRGALSSLTACLNGVVLKKGIRCANMCEMCGSHGGKDVDVAVPGFDAV
jgi:hypothetical protein